MTIKISEVIEAGIAKTEGKLVRLECKDMLNVFILFAEEMLTKAKELEEKEEEYRKDGYRYKPLFFPLKETIEKEKNKKPAYWVEVYEIVEHHRRLEWGLIIHVGKLKFSGNKFYTNKQNAVRAAKNLEKRYGVEFRNGEPK